MKTDRRKFLKTSISALALAGMPASFNIINKQNFNIFSDGKMKLTYKKI